MLCVFALWKSLCVEKRILFSSLKQRKMSKEVREFLSSLMESRGVGQVRKVHIIYFLSRKGSVEHPHLIRIHHLSRNGVHLRDVKRWLSDLRGKDMPESFAWSYKRKYKTGYVWQDLLDEDLITPISDNEYVLKGSEILSPSYNNDFSSFDEKKVSTENKTTEVKDKNKPSLQEEIQRDRESPMDVSTKASSEIEEESPFFSSESSALTDASIKIEEDNNYSSTLLDDDNNNKDNVKMENISSTQTSSSSKRSSFSKSKSHSSGATQMLRNLIKCGAVDTNEKAVVVINKHSRNTVNLPTQTKNSHTSDVCKGDKLLGDSRQIFGMPFRQYINGRKSCDWMKGSKGKISEFSNQRSVSAAYRPVNGPICSQCRKQFMPEKMHAHMKSCKGVKAMMKGTSPAVSFAPFQERPEESTEFHNKDSVCSYFLTN